MRPSSWRQPTQQTESASESGKRRPGHSGGASRPQRKEETTGSFSAGTVGAPATIKTATPLNLMKKTPNAEYEMTVARGTNGSRQDGTACAPETAGSRRKGMNEAPETNGRCEEMTDSRKTSGSWRKRGNAGVSIIAPPPHVQHHN
jgi:hypothetical protein